MHSPARQAAPTKCLVSNRHPRKPAKVMSESGAHRGVERANLAALQVEVNEEKSRIVDLSRGESFGFLGFDLERFKRWSG